MLFAHILRSSLIAAATLSVALHVVPATAQKAPPATDIPGASDSEVVGRLPGALIVAQDALSIDLARYPKSKLLRQKGPRVQHNNIPYEPDDDLTVEGERLRTVYLADSGTSPYAAARAYEKAVEKQGGEVVWSCRGEDCGGRTDTALAGGGGHLSLGQWLWDRSKIGGKRGSPGRCAQLVGIADQHYRLFRISASGAVISLHSYTLKPWAATAGACMPIDGRTVAIVDVVTPDGGPAELTTVTATDMRSEIADTGRIALYGINFDTAKATLRPESTAIVSEIAALLDAEPGLRLLIVGHTDNEGSFQYNQQLSEARAKSVVAALVGTHGISRERLFPVGVSFASPVATNATDEGRAQNRRVELVQF